MTRIVSGTLGGRRLQTPVGDGTRPTSERVREALFSSLSSAFGGFEGLRVLDLFAGSGALGIEAISRGAVWADFVEHDAKAVKIITANLSDLGITQAKLTRGSAHRFLQSSPTEPYDVLFLDPPYSMSLVEVTRLLEVLSGDAWRAAGAIFVVERPKREEFAWPVGIEAWRDKKYGDTRIWYGR